MNITEQYHEILNEILKSGKVKENRTGTETLSIFDYTIKINMQDGFPLISTKKLYTKGIITELLWFLSGSTNIQHLVKRGNNIWVGDAYKSYKTYTKSLEEPDYEVHVDDPNMNCTRILSESEFIEQIKSNDKFAITFGELGPIYGKQWTNCGGWYSKNHWDNKKNSFGKNITGINQIQEIINLLKIDPDSRRILVNSWNVSDISKMVLPPCHWAFELYTEELTGEERYNLWFTNNYETGMERNYDPLNLPNFDDEYYIITPKRRLHLKWHQRSVDTFLGLPFNIASYAFLLEMIAQQVNMIPGTLVGDLTNVHIYTDHIEYAIKQLERDPLKYKLPKLKLNKANDIFSYRLEDFEIAGYQSYPNWTGKNKPNVSN